MRFVDFLLCSNKRRLFELSNFAFRVVGIVVSMSCMFHLSLLDDDLCKRDCPWAVSSWIMEG